MANLPLRLAVRAHLRPLSTAGCPVGCLKMRRTASHWHSRHTLGVLCLGTVRSEDCGATIRRTRASVPPSRMTQCVVAGIGAARDGAACAEPSAAAGGRCRCALRGGADLAAVGAALDGLRGDGGAQGKPRFCPARAFGLHGRTRNVGRVTCGTGLDALQVFDVARARPDSCSTGPLRRSSRLRTLRAMASA